MPDSKDKRRFLDQWSERGGDVQELAEAYPNCGCEDADAAEGGFGPVSNDETLRFFVLATSHIDRKNKKKFRAASLQRLFKSGLSTCRLDHSSSEEIRRTAVILSDLMRKQSPQRGGIMGAVDFNCGVVRELTSEDGLLSICVVDTPLDRQSDGSFLRPAHADLVYGKIECPNSGPYRLLVFNAIKMNNPEGFCPISQLDGGALADLAPAE